MVVRALAYIAVTVPVAMLSDPDPTKSTSLNPSAAAFAAIMVPGILFAIAIGFACYFFLKTKEWLRPHEGGQELDELPPSPWRSNH